MKKTLKQQFIIYFIITVSISMLLMAFIISYVINKRFENYVYHNQQIRDESIVEYFKSIYIKDGTFTENSGIELVNHAELGEYNLSLLDSNKKTLWKMDDESLLYAHQLMGHNKIKYHVQLYPIKVNDNNVGYVKIGQFGDLIFTKSDIEFKNDITIGLIIAFVISVIIALLTAFYLSKKLTQSITTITNVANEMSLGNLDIRICDCYDVVEIESLKCSCNQLADSLLKQEKLRKQLTADVSHELRTPLNILLGEIEAIIDKVYEPTIERLEGCREEILRLSYLVTELEKLALIENVDNNSEESFLINEQIKRITKSFDDLFDLKKIKLKLDLDKDIYIKCDLTKFDQILYNLIGNAHKYTDNGKVTISTNIIDNKLHLNITDTGIGIDKNELPYVFERFYRVDKSRNRASGGMGIGLSIVKSILDKNNWDIKIESELNQGTSITIIIPNNN